MNTNQFKNHQSKIMKNQRLEMLKTITAIIITAGAIAISSPIQAQDDIRSSDLTKALKVFVESTSAAQSSEAAAHSKASDLIKGAAASEARAGDTNLPPQSRFEANITAIGLQTQAARAKLDAARQNAKLLAAAGDALREIRHDLGGEATQSLNDLPTSDEQAKVNDGIANLKFAGDGEIDPDTAEALRADREFFDAVAKGSPKGPGSAAVLQTVARRLSAWQAKNRRGLVLADSALRRLELAAVSGLAAVGNFRFDQASTNLSDLTFAAPFAPEISANEAAVSSRSSKVSLRQALGR